MTADEKQAFLDYYNAHLEFPGKLIRGTPQNYVGAVMALSGTFYFREGWTRNKREAICRCLTRYLEVVQDHILWLVAEDSPIEPYISPYSKVKPLTDVYSKIDEDYSVIRTYKGGKTANDASPYCFHIGTHARWEEARDEKYNKDYMDVLRFSLPVRIIQEKPVLFQKLFLKFAQELQAFHGFGGLRLELPPDSTDDDPTEAWLAQQSNGIVAGDDFLSTSYLNPLKLKSISWLTVLGNDLLSHYDNLILRQELPPSWYAVYNYDHGTVIQAGNLPDAAQFPLHSHPATYVLINMLMKPFRTDYCTIHVNSLATPLITGKQSVALWLSRFDVPDEQLIEYKHKLTQMPVLKKKHVLYDAVDPHFQHLYR